MQEEQRNRATEVSANKWSVGDYVAGRTSKCSFSGKIVHITDDMRPYLVECSSGGYGVDSYFNFLDYKKINPSCCYIWTKDSEIEMTVKVAEEKEPDMVNSPQHYGGSANPYEAIKVIRAWGLSFGLGNVAKYISRAGKKNPDKLIEDLEKARWYLDDEIRTLKAEAKK